MLPVFLNAQKRRGRAKLVDGKSIHIIQGRTNIKCLGMAYNLTPELLTVIAASELALCESAPTD